jgi:hypothetical protein
MVPLIEAMSLRLKLPKIAIYSIYTKNYKKCPYNSFKLYFWQFRVILQMLERSKKPFLSVPFYRSSRMLGDFVYLPVSHFPADLPTLSATILYPER